MLLILWVCVDISISRKEEEEKITCHVLCVTSHGRRHVCHGQTAIKDPRMNQRRGLFIDEMYTFEIFSLIYYSHVFYVHKFH